MRPATTLFYDTLVRVGAALAFTRYSFHVEAFVHESILFSPPSPSCIGHTVAIQKHDYWAVYEPPSDLLLYAMYHTILAITISCKGQDAPGYDPLL